MICDEHSFSFVALFNAYIVVSPAYVEFKEQGCFLDARNEFADKWKKILIVYGPFVQSSVVLNRSKLSVFLLNEKERGCVWAFLWAYVAFFNVFFDELLKCFLFVLHQGVDFSRQHCWGIFLEFYRVVPQSWSREPLCFLFTEYMGMSLVVFREWL